MILVIYDLTVYLRITDIEYSSITSSVGSAIERFFMVPICGWPCNLVGRSHCN